MKIRNITEGVLCVFFFTPERSFSDCCFGMSPMRDIHVIFRLNFSPVYSVCDIYLFSNATKLSNFNVCILEVLYIAFLIIFSPQNGADVTPV